MVVMPPSLLTGRLNATFLNALAGRRWWGITSVMAVLSDLPLREVSRYIRGALTPISGTRSYLGLLRELNGVQTHRDPRYGASRRYAFWNNTRQSTLATSISI
jgi:hypothetical protein